MSKIEGGLRRRSHDNQVSSGVTPDLRLRDDSLCKKGPGIKFEVSFEYHFGIIACKRLPFRYHFGIAKFQSTFWQFFQGYLSGISLETLANIKLINIIAQM